MLKDLTAFTILAETKPTTVSVECDGGTAKASALGRDQLAASYTSLEKPSTFREQVGCHHYPAGFSDRFEWVAYRPNEPDLQSGYVRALKVVGQASKMLLLIAPLSVQTDTNPSQPGGFFYAR